MIYFHYSSSFLHTYSTAYYTFPPAKIKTIFVVISFFCNFVLKEIKRGFYQKRNELPEKYIFIIFS